MSNERRPTTMTGVSTRVLEIYGGPFEDETAASLMHQQAGEDCGWAGPAFIERLVQTDERQIIDAYEEMLSYVRDISEGKNGSHIAGISVVALADALIDYWFFGAGKEAAWDRAKRMARNILVDQVEGNATDVNENAVQFIVDWVLSNKAYFGTKAILRQSEGLQKMPVQRSQRGMPLYAGDAALRLGR